MFDNSSILVTGGTGSFGRKFIETMLKHHKLDHIAGRRRFCDQGL